MGMDFKKVLWLDVETTSLDTRVASILDLSYMIDIDREISPCQSQLIKPLLHKEDQLYRSTPIIEAVNKYNQALDYTQQDRLWLDLFRFAPDEEPLFHYALSILKFNERNGLPYDPEKWLTDKKRTFPKLALKKLVNDLKEAHKVQKHWVLAGYNVKFDREVLLNWSQRVCIDDYLVLKSLLDNLILDVLDLTRWAKCFNHPKLKDAHNLKLTTVSECLGINLNEAHTAKADIMATRNVALTLLNKEK